ncbi:hypothetical protein EDD86DRAFT_260660, partial [Gorgonomyces haynaldii]
SVESGPATKDSGPPRRSIHAKDGLISQPHADVKTLYDIIRYGAKQFPATKHCLGQRSVVKVFEEQKQVTKTIGGITTTETKTFKFPQLTAYSWMTYRDVVEATNQIGAGLKHLGLRQKDKVTLFASTQRDWMLMAHACFSQDMTITTAYDTLGEEGLSFSLNEGEITTLFTQVDLFSMVEKVSQRVPSLKIVIYTGQAKDLEIEKKLPQIKFYSIEQVRQLGIAHPVNPVPPTPDSIACIMYTSGSTGNPKGVVLTHANVIAAVAGSAKAMDGFIKDEDVYLGYLPLAHILEFTVEHFSLFAGAKIGYGSPRTLRDVNVKDSRGDLLELAPTFMCGVPMVWETIRKGIVSKIKSLSPTTQYIFNIAYQTKRVLISLGLPTSFIDKTIFKSVKDNVGGRLKITLSGGAPLAAETQEFLNVVLCPMIQGYGMTETSVGSLSLQTPDQFGIYGTVGSPFPSVEIKLVASGSYDPNPTDPTVPPRGEIWTRGGNIMQGYYKQPETTKEALNDGWLMTGDIGEWGPEGTLKIIDRKKNLVKLAHGEYVALEKLEAQYKTSPFVLNMCIHADPLKSHIVAIILPAEPEIVKLAEEKGIKEQFSTLITHPDIVHHVVRDLESIAKQSGFKGAEILKVIRMVEDEWTPENEKLTAAQKLKRKEIVQCYKSEIDAMYSLH